MTHAARRTLMGLMPEIDSRSGSSTTARIAVPNRVNLSRSDNKTVETIEMATTMMSLTVTNVPPIAKVCNDKNAG